MSNIPYDDDNYTAESFGQPMPARQRRGPNRGLLFTCGAVSAVLLLVVCCCAGGLVLFARSPSGAATVWGASAITGTWSFVPFNPVCENTRAELITDLYRDNNVVISDFVSSSTADSNNTIAVEGFIEGDDVERQKWEAVFYTVDDRGGLFPVCITDIEVNEGTVLLEQLPDVTTDDDVNQDDFGPLETDDGNAIGEEPINEESGE